MPHIIRDVLGTNRIEGNFYFEPKRETFMSEPAKFQLKANTISNVCGPFIKLFGKKITHVINLSTGFAWYGTTMIKIALKYSIAFCILLVVGRTHVTAQPVSDHNNNVSANFSSAPAHKLLIRPDAPASRSDVELIYDENEDDHTSTKRFLSRSGISLVRPYQHQNQSDIRIANGFDNIITVRTFASYDSLYIAFRVFRI